MIAFPFFFPFTTPFALTVTIFLLEELYVILAVGVAVALIAAVFPFFNEIDVLDTCNARPENETTFGSFFLSDEFTL